MADVRNRLQEKQERQFRERGQGMRERAMQPFNAPQGPRRRSAEPTIPPKPAAAVPRNPPSTAMPGVPTTTTTLIQGRNGTMVIDQPTAPQPKTRFIEGVGSVTVHE